MQFDTLTILQLVVALGLLNVWVLRVGKATPYRGGESRTLKEEFSAYGLSDAVFRLVGFLKIASAVALIVGLWVPALVLPAASLVAALMVGALLMHLKVKDPAIRSLPAGLMLVMNAAMVYLSLG
jgi:hypothetical protein